MFYPCLLRVRTYRYYRKKKFESVSLKVWLRFYTIPAIRKNSTTSLYPVGLYLLLICVGTSCLEALVLLRGVLSSFSSSMGPQVRILLINGADLAAQCFPETFWIKKKNFVGSVACPGCSVPDPPDQWRTQGGCTGCTCIPPPPLCIPPPPCASPPLPSLKREKMRQLATRKKCKFVYPKAYGSVSATLVYDIFHNLWPNRALISIRGLLIFVSPFGDKFLLMKLL